MEALKQPLVWIIIWASSLPFVWAISGAYYGLTRTKCFKIKHMIKGSKNYKPRERYKIHSEQGDVGDYVVFWPVYCLILLIYKTLRLIKFISDKTGLSNLIKKTWMSFYNLEIRCKNT